jgi:DNA-binding CsgD family transcriptional regulator
MKVLEAVYDVEQPRDRWLTGVLQSLSSTLDQGAGVGGVLYDVSGEGHVPIDAIEGIGLPADWREAAITMHQDSRNVPRVIAGYRSILCATLPELTTDPQVHGRLHHELARHQVGGQIVINGIDCSGRGCALYLFSRGPLTLSPAQRSVFEKFATHLSTAYRLQRRLAGDDPAVSAPIDAVLTPNGRVDHAEVAAAQSKNARRELQQAVRQRERVRDIVKTDPQRAVSSFKGLVEARWTLVDHYERGGQRYVLARENAPKPLPLAPLSPREQQVVALAALGRTNKLIAYELGLAHSTVRVLMARASVKLGTTTRSDLIARQQSIKPR